MSTNTNTDLTEEDAADLQFPKEDVIRENILITDSQNSCEIFNSQCSSCHSDLVPPYILCVICDTNICSLCVANGAEFSTHKNDHSYRVLTHNFVLFDNSDWSAKEELTLLESLLQYGNWNLIAKTLPGRSPKEVKEHYDYYYIQRRGSPLLPQVPEHENPVYPSPVVPYRFILNGIEDPPRYASNSVGYHSLAGYNPARSDFELEYDANAEDMVASLKCEVSPSDPDYKVMTDLQCSIISSYNRRLRERQRRKAIIRNHGLILLRKTGAAMHRYDLTITRPVYERFLRFAQFFHDADQFNYMLEGLHRAGELKMQIARLCDFHKKGIKTLAGARLYMKLKNDHEESCRDVKQFKSDPRLNINLKNSVVPSNALPPAKKRGTFTPIEIIGMPGYEKLQPNEMELCKNIRLVPLTYIELRDILIAENKKFGYLKLQTARRLLKIDVNKTRRLYDFLVQEGYITKPII